MDRSIKQLLTAAALALFALLPTGCSNDDDFGNPPAGSIPLELGDVTVAGMTTTRAAVTEDPSTGYTGIRKSRFVNGDVLKIESTNPRSGGTVTSTDNATLTGGAWVLDAKVYVIPGTTTIKATYSPTAPAGMLPDRLAADTYTLVGQKLKLDLKHVNALVDITCPAGVTPTDITLIANDGNADQSHSTAAEEESDGTVHYRSILAPGTVKSITATINGNTYIAILTPALTVAANKRYPVALTFKANQLTATVGSGELNWGIGDDADMLPAGYTRLIGTPEDLAQFAKDVNDDAAGTGARIATVLQTADIDMSRLMTAADATTAYGKTYTYTATPDQWIPIGLEYRQPGPTATPFTGKYNGNGYTISNVKQVIPTGLTANVYGGLFHRIEGAMLTGIHLRNFSMVEENIADGGFIANMGALVSTAYNSHIALCSATGSIRIYWAEWGMGGLIGKISGTSGSTCYVTRCSADVDIYREGDFGGEAHAGFVGYASNTVFAGCRSEGDVTYITNSYVGGFVGKIDGAVQCIGCSCSDALTNTEGRGFLGAPGDNDISSSFISCYSTMTGGGDFASDPKAVVTFTNCAYTGTSSLTGVMGNLAPAAIYAALTASNATLIGVQTLHWSKADGYTFDIVNETWHAKHIWKDNGTAAPTIDMAYEGGVNSI